MNKMRQVRIRETIDHRYPGALRIIDRVTGREVRRSFRVTAPGLSFFANRSALQVISHAQGLEHHLDEFDSPPGAPPPGLLEFTLAVEDPLGEYLDRSMTIRLPRVPVPENPASLFKAIDISMFAAPAAHLSPNWSIIRASLFDFDDMDARVPVPGALLRVLNGEEGLIMSGMTDLRGEAVVMIPGIPITRFAQGAETPEEEDEDWLASGAVIETETPVLLEVIVQPGTPWPVDPDLMETNHGDLRRPFSDDGSEALKERLALALKTGKTQSINLFVS